MFNEKDYRALRKEIIDWIPNEIIDSHVHTATRLGSIKSSLKDRFKLSYGLLNNRMLSVRDDVFSRALPGIKVVKVGFPLPNPFDDKDADIWNNELLVNDMKRGIIGALYGFNDVDSLNSTVEKAKKENLKLRGIKIHPRLCRTKERKDVVLKDVLPKEILDFAEKNKLTMIVELSHGFFGDDLRYLLDIDKNYDIKIVIPHMGMNYLFENFYNGRGMSMSFKEYKETLSKKTDLFEKEYSKLKETERIFFDSSMVIDKRAIEALVNVLGKEKLSYGSDYPFCFSQKIDEMRDDIPILVDNLRKIIDGKYSKVKNLWKYDINVLLMIKALKDGCPDGSREIMSENAKMVFGV